MLAVEEEIPAKDNNPELAVFNELNSTEYETIAPSVILPLIVCDGAPAIPIQYDPVLPPRI